MAGDEAHVHIHQEGRRYHVKNSVTNVRVNFDINDEEQVRHVYKRLKKDEDLHGKGLIACAYWQVRLIVVIRIFEVDYNDAKEK